MSLREDALTMARTELHSGAREIGGNNRGIWVKKYLGGAGLAEGFPWCASFMSWCFREAAKANGVKMPFPYSPGARKLFNICKTKGWKVAMPQPGDMVFWKRGPAGAGLGHVGFVEYAHDDLIQTIEGNHTSLVARFRYEWMHDERLLGFIRVPF